MAETKTVTGIVTEVERKQTSGGKDYVSVTMNGERYSIWDAATGASAELCLNLHSIADASRKEGSRYWNITAITMAHDQPQEHQGITPAFNIGTMLALRQSALQAAATVYSGAAEPDSDVILALAREFELYLIGKAFD